MSKPSDLWSELKRLLRRRKRRQRGAGGDAAPLEAELLEERRLLAVTALVDLLAAGSADGVEAEGLAGEAAELAALAQSAGVADALDAAQWEQLSRLQEMAGDELPAPSQYAPEVVSAEPALFAMVARNDFQGVGASVRSLQFNLADADYEPAEIPPIGIAVVGAQPGDGRWQFTRDFGATWDDMGPVSDRSALLLEPDARLRFVPGRSDSEALFAYRAWDLSRHQPGERVDLSAQDSGTAFSRESGVAVAQVWTLAVVDAPLIDADGRTELTFSLSGLEDGEYLVNIDWGDGKHQLFGEVGNGAHTAAHTYTLGLGGGRAASPVPVTLEATELVSGDYDPGSTRVPTLALPADADFSLADWADALQATETATATEATTATDGSNPPQAEMIEGDSQFAGQLSGLSGVAAVALAAITAGDRNWRQRVEQALESPESDRRVRRLRRRRRGL